MNKQNIIERELKSIPRGKGGELSAHAIVEWSLKHKQSETYKDLEKFSRNATMQAMLARASVLIRLHIVFSSKTGQRVELSIRKTEDAPHGGVRPLSLIESNKLHIQSAKTLAISELLSTCERFSKLVPELKPIWNLIEKLVLKQAA